MLVRNCDEPLYGVLLAQEWGHAHQYWHGELKVGQSEREYGFGKEGRYGGNPDVRSPVGRCAHGELERLESRQSGQYRLEDSYYGAETHSPWELRFAEINV